MPELLERRMLEAVVKDDHGGLDGLANDDHPQYIKDAEFTAAEEVLVGTGDGTFGQVTLAASQFLAKKAAGAATNVTAAEARTILNVADGADVTGANPPQAHEGSHDPEDGSDKLDCAAPVDIGTANAEGDAHSFARSNHVHKIPNKWRTRTFNIEIPLPDAADGFLVHWFPKASTLVAIHTDTEAATSVTFNMYERPTSDSWSGGVKVDASDHVATTGFLDMDLDNNTGMAADSCLIFVASAVSGSPGNMRVWGEYLVD